MTDHLLAPEQRITIAGKEYTLNGSFKALKDIQHAFDTEILQFLIGKVSWLSFDDAAKVIRIGIEASGATPPDAEAIEQSIVDDIGIVEVRQIIGAWLVLATSPKRDREKKAKELKESLKTKPASRGKSTGSSA